MMTDRTIIVVVIAWVVSRGFGGIAFLCLNKIAQCPRTVQKLVPLVECACSANLISVALFVISIVPGTIVALTIIRSVSSVIANIVIGSSDKIYRLAGDGKASVQGIDVNRLVLDGSSADHLNDVAETLALVQLSVDVHSKGE